MASSPSEPATPTAFALQELTACWDQGCEALARGDLEKVAALMAIADGHLGGLPPARADSPAEQRLRHAAMAARGRLEHGMQAGLAGVRDELGKVRHGARALSGYRDPTRGVGSRVVHDA
jgi:hypothetical protein